MCTHSRTVNFHNNISCIFPSGKRSGFYKIRQHYHILLRNKYGDDATQLIRQEFPALALGISGASLHCLEV